MRVVGGAYGGFCRFDPRSGDFKYLSYRDPNLGQTLETYDGAPGWRIILAPRSAMILGVASGDKNIWCFFIRFFKSSSFLIWQLAIRSFV